MYRYDVWFYGRRFVRANPGDKVFIQDLDFFRRHFIFGKLHVFGDRAFGTAIFIDDLFIGPIVKKIAFQDGSDEVLAQLGARLPDRLSQIGRCFGLTACLCFRGYGMRHRCIAFDCVRL